jgi:D-glycero-alpha-D-manno-heptose-7-phosphate kinase
MSAIQVQPGRERLRPRTMVYRAKAPLRVSFAGGGTDVPPFPSLEGGLVLSATINRYAYGVLTPRDDAKIRIESVDYGLELNYGADEELTLDGKLDLVKAAIHKVGHEQARGLDLLLHSSAPPGSGLGSSSAVMVTLIGLLREYYRLSLTDYDVAQLAYMVEREDLGIRGGLQDQYAAAFGGFNYIEFESDRVIVNPLRIPPEVVHELEHNMLLCFTGRTRASDHIIEDQAKRFINGDEQALEGLRRQKELARAMKEALLCRRLDEFGDLLGTAWRYKKQMSSRITTPFIDEAYEAAIHAGALGGKVTGAGGGGYMLFFCPFRRKHKVAEVLTGMGAPVIEFEFTDNGLTTWSFEP